MNHDQTPPSSTLPLGSSSDPTRGGQGVAPAPAPVPSGPQYLPAQIGVAVQLPGSAPQQPYPQQGYPQHQQQTYPQQPQPQQQHAHPQPAAGRTDELNTGGARTVFEFTGVHAAKEASKGTFIGNVSSVPDVGNARAERGATNLSRGVPAWLIILVGLGIVGGGVAFALLGSAGQDTTEVVAPAEVPAAVAPAEAPVVAPDPAVPLPATGTPPVVVGTPPAPGTPPAVPPAGTPPAATPPAPAPAPAAPKPAPKKAPKKPAPAPAPVPAPKTIKPSKPARDGLDGLPKPP